MNDVNRILGLSLCRSAPSADIYGHAKPVENAARSACVCGSYQVQRDKESGLLYIEWSRFVMSSFCSCTALIGGQAGRGTRAFCGACNVLTRQYDHVKNQVSSPGGCAN